MKTCITTLFCALCACVAVAGEAPSEPKSVLAAAPAPVAAVEACDSGACGTCCTSSDSRHSCRQGLFGRTIERTRTVTRAVVEVPVRVVAAPARVFRARRACCCQ